jgi:uncharacterized protein YkwD
MPLSDRDFIRGRHPPNCHCVDCVNKRLGIGTEILDTKNQSDTSTYQVQPNIPTRHHKKPSLNVIYSVLFVIALSVFGFGVSLLTGSKIPLWLLVGFSVIFSLEKWFHYPLGKQKILGKLYRLLLNLVFLSLLVILIWTGIKLFSKEFTQSALIGSLIFISELSIFIWLWRVLARNSWRWPSFKLTVFSIIVLFTIFSFAGVQPFKDYKDSSLQNVTSWWKSISAKENFIQPSITQTSITTTVPQNITETNSVLENIKEFFVPSTDINDYVLRFNSYRQSKSRNPLTFTEDLNKVAALRLEEIKIDFSHYSKGGYNKHLAENIVMGISGNQEALECWQKSPGHNTNMLDPSYVYTGYAIGNGYAIQVFTEYKTINGEPQLPPGWYWDD